MTGFDESAELYRVVQLMNSRGGLAGTFAKDTAEDQRIVEILTAKEFARSLRNSYGLSVEAIELNSLPK